MTRIASVHPRVGRLHHTFDHRRPHAQLPRGGCRGRGAPNLPDAAAFDGGQALAAADRVGVPEECIKKREGRAPGGEPALFASVKGTRISPWGGLGDPPRPGAWRRPEGGDGPPYCNT